MADANALFNHATSRLLAGEAEAALVAFEHLLSHFPRHPEALLNSGLIHFRAGRLEPAAACFKAAAECRPGYASAHRNLAVVARALGDGESEASALRALVTLSPGDLDGIVRLAGLCYEQRRFAEAAEMFRRAHDLAPDQAGLLGDLAAALRMDSRLTEAEQVLRRSVALDPASPHIRNTLGSTLKSAGRVEEALEAFDAAIAMDPFYAEAYWNKATALLLGGRLTEGWDLLDWRWKVANFPSPIRRFDAPEWTGEPVAGRRLLVHFEQGFGDTIQFVRYGLELKRRGATVIVECHRPLARLLRTLPWLDVVAADGDPLPQFDCYVAMMSLPGRLRLPHIPPAPYLAAPPDLAAEWRQRLGGGGELKVGLVWAGRPTHGNDHLRSTTLDMLEPLAEVPGVRFHSLQKGREVTPAGRLKPMDLGAAFEDFADTAAAIAALDLVITVDTSVAHLAGAMGTPTWVMLPYAPDWRWLLGRDDSPWYPSLRLFRQPTEQSGWEPVIARIGAALREKVGCR